LQKELTSINFLPTTVHITRLNNHIKTKK